MKKINWKVKIHNPINYDEILEEAEFKSIEEISNKYNKIPLNTWRNICIGRSKVYKHFIDVEKVPITLNNVDCVKV